MVEIDLDDRAIEVFSLRVTGKEKYKQWKNRGVMFT